MFDSISGRLEACHPVPRAQALATPELNTAATTNSLSVVHAAASIPCLWRPLVGNAEYFSSHIIENRIRLDSLGHVQSSIEKS